MFEGKIYFFQNETSLRAYDIEKNIPSYNTMPIFSLDSKPFRFRMTPHLKDIGTPYESIELIYLFSYTQSQENVTVSKNTKVATSVWKKLGMTSNALENIQEDVIEVKSVQRVNLTTIEFNSKTFEFTETGTKSTR